MRIKIKEYLVDSKKSVWFEKDGNMFWINKTFIKKGRKGVFAEFPKWASQIYVKHNNMMYEIFLYDFEQYMKHQIPIPFDLHFPRKIEKPIKLPKKSKTKPVPRNDNIEPFKEEFSLEPTHNELVLARRNGEI